MLCHAVLLAGKQAGDPSGQRGDRRAASVEVHDQRAVSRVQRRGKVFHE
jgi:hypothetical protein